MDVQKLLVVQASVVAVHRSTFTVCMTLVVLEFFQHLELERTLVWTSKWSLIKCLFLLGRYLPLGIVAAFLYYISAPSSPTIETCRRLFSGGSILVAIACLCADAVLYIRVYALSKQSKRMKAILITQYAIVSLNCLAGMVMLVNSRPAAPPTKLSGLAACVSIPSAATDRWAIVQFSLLLYSAAFTMLASLWYGVRLSWSVKSAPSVSTLIRIFYMDGAFYFAAITAISIANFAVSTYAPRPYRLLLAVPQAAVHGMLATRMILHLREVASVQLIEQVMQALELEREQLDPGLGEFLGVQRSNSRLHLEESNL
ncbi:hypothetical protein BKA70DRAFT_824323 [Coprinopsis sp. MPI-PUGE-AT-0042]|nr:hypothetical protein BKA70DRAFT_824323 [Coprinopsis sp. MPI-PUGE-AT-0042]